MSSEIFPKWNLNCYNGPSNLSTWLSKWNIRKIDDFKSYRKVKYSSKTANSKFFSPISKKVNWIKAAVNSTWPHAKARIHRIAEEQVAKIDKPSVMPALNSKLLQFSCYPTHVHLEARHSWHLDGAHNCWFFYL